MEDHQHQHVEPAAAQWAAGPPVLTAPPVRRLNSLLYLMMVTPEGKSSEQKLLRSRASLQRTDQNSSRQDGGQSTASGAQVGVELRRLDGRWKVTDLDLLGQPLRNG